MRSGIHDTRVEPTEQWLDTHRPHLQRRGGELFEEAPLKNAPPDYPSRWILCPCGAKHLTDLPSEEIRP